MHAEWGVITLETVIYEVPSEVVLILIYQFINLRNQHWSLAQWTKVNRDYLSSVSKSNRRLFSPCISVDFLQNKCLFKWKVTQKWDSVIIYSLWWFSFVEHHGSYFCTTIHTMKGKNNSEITKTTLSKVTKSSPLLYIPSVLKQYSIFRWWKKN